MSRGEVTCESRLIFHGGIKGCIEKSTVTPSLLVARNAAAGADDLDGGNYKGSGIEMNSDYQVSADKMALARFLSRVCVDANADSYSGKRDATRFTEGAPLEVMVDPKKPSRISNVYMHNASDGGCAFWIKKKIDPRAVVHLRACAEEGVDPWVKGDVTHCTVGIRGYLVGISFGEG